MSTPFLELQATHNPHRWILPVTPRLCVGPSDRAFMFGGVGLAAAIAALEWTCGRAVVWASAQYLSFARPPSIIDLEVRIPARGARVSQARALALVGDREILTVNAALGEALPGDSHQWVSAPAAPPPEACEESHRWSEREENLHSHIEVRVAQGRHGPASPDWGELSADGRMILWLRPRGDWPIDRAMLAIMADHVPSGIGHALGRNSSGANSLDNTIRFRRLTPTDWVLCDVQIHAIDGGYAHGSMRLYSRAGELLATASQSMILRLREARGAGPPLKTA